MKNSIKNKLAIVGLGITLVFSLSGCKDYLNVEPIDRLTGNNYYLSQKDVESNLAFIYAQFFSKIDESWVMGAIGEARSGEIFVSEGANGFNSRKVVEALGDNNLWDAMNNPNYSPYRMYEISRWDRYYEVIQSVNILVNKLEEGIPGVEGSDQTRYIAEAMFHLFLDGSALWRCSLLY